MKYAELKAKIADMKKASAWGKAMKTYALECLEYAEQCGVKDDTEADKISLGSLMNHVGGNAIKIGTWHSRAALDIIKEASEGGNFLIYNEDIAKRLCSPSHFKAMHRKDGTLKDPRRKTGFSKTSLESWIDMQTRCLIHAVWEIQAIAAGRRV